MRTETKYSLFSRQPISFHQKQYESGGRRRLVQYKPTEVNHGRERAGKRHNGQGREEECGEMENGKGSFGRAKRERRNVALSFNLGKPSIMAAAMTKAD